MVNHKYFHLKKKKKKSLSVMSKAYVDLFLSVFSLTRLIYDSCTNSQIMGKVSYLQFHQMIEVSALL